MDKITEALKKLLPESEINEVAASINESLEQAKTELEAEYNAKLEEAYKERRLSLNADKAIATLAESISEAIENPIC